jgi:hypothetical protein
MATTKNSMNLLIAFPQLNQLIPAAFIRWNTYLPCTDYLTFALP